MICFAAIVAHPVLSVPAIGKGADTSLEQTIKAIGQIKHELHAAKPDTVVIISPHVKAPATTLTINQTKVLTITLRDFGDLTPYGTMINNVGMGYQLRQRVETSIPLVTIENSELDHGTSVPLFHLHESIAHVPIVSIGTAHELDLVTHYTCGQQWRQTLEVTNERIAVIVSADLTHDIKNQVSTDAAHFDSKIIHWVEKSDTKALLALPNDNTLVQNVCGLRPIALVFGLVQDKAISVESLSYERTHGIGYYNALIHVR